MLILHACVILEVLKRVSLSSMTTISSLAAIQSAAY
jgi:hypothetical protein